MRGKIHRRNLSLDARVLHVSHETDDLDIRRQRVRRANAHTLPDRVRAEPEAPREGLVHDGDLRRAGTIRVGELASGEPRHTNRPEAARSDGVEAGARFWIVGIGVEALNPDGVV